MPVVPNPGIRIDGKLNNPKAATRKNLSTDMKVGRQNVFDYTDSSVSDGTTNARTAILAADAVGPVTLPPGTYAIASNMTLSNKVAFDPGAKLKPASGITVTLSDGYIAEDTQHVFDISAGGTIAARNMSRLSSAHFGTIADYAYPSTGTDNSSAFQACFDAVDEMAQAVGSQARKKAWAYVPPGSYRCNTALTVGNYTNLDMSGVLLMYFGSRASSGAFLTIGDSAGEIETGTFYMPAAQGSPTDFDMPLNEQDYAGVHIKNCGSSLFMGDAIYAFGVGLRLKSDGDSYVAHNHFMNFKFSVVRTAIEFFGTSPAGWVNENVFTNCNWTGTSSEDGWGTLTGIKFTGETGGYAGQNNNRFYGMCFQPPGNPTAYELDIGDTVVAHQRYINRTTQQEYVCVTGGTVATVPTVLAQGTSSPDANGVVFTHVGHYFRVPVWFDKAGGHNQFSGSRWEYGHGPFAMINPSIYSRGNEMEAYELGVPNDRNVPMIDDFTLAESNESAGSRNTFRVYSDRAGDKATFDAIHKRFIASATGMCVKGMVYYDYSTDVINRYSSYVEFDLCKDRLVQSAYQLLGVVVDLSICRRVEAKAVSNDGTSLSNWAAPLDVHDKFVDVVDAANNLVISNGAFLSGRWFIGGELVYFALGSSTTIKHAFVGYGGGGAIPSSCFEVSAVPGGAYQQSQLSILTPDTGRFSHGTPTAGFFETLGEYISNINTASGQPSGWIVKTAGILAPAWAGTATVLSGSLRLSDTNKIYTARSAGTTGSTAPTGTGTSINDGSILWDYVGPIAVLEAAYYSAYPTNVTASTADLASIAATINTVNKFEGKQVFNTTTNKPVYAAGSAAGDVWVDATGSTAHTPV